MVGSATLVKSAVMSDNKAHSFEEQIGAMTEPHENETLAELVQRGAEGDEKALEAIYHRFKTPLFNLACRYTCDVDAAEDILQEVFLTAFTHLADLENVARFPGWLFRIAINTSLGHIRSRKAERRNFVRLSELAGVMAVPSDEESSSTLRRLLEEAIQALPERLKSVFLLHDVEGFKHEEIARILGCTVGTSKSHLFKARLKLRAHLSNPRLYKE